MLLYDSYPLSWIERQFDPNAINVWDCAVFRVGDTHCFGVLEDLSGRSTL